MRLLETNLKNKKVIIRVDYNVPIQNNIIQSTKRINASLPTLNFILEQNPKQIIIISHLGRPKTIDEYSLEPVRKYLENKINHSVILAKNLEINPNDFIVLLENIRHHPEETKNIESTPEFRKKLTSMCDVYINDAFGCSHRAHSSIVGINPPEKYLGFLVEKEVKYLDNVFDQKGVKTLILGGSKIVDKIQLIKNLIPKFNNILIGGGMAFTFLKYFGYEIGSSIFDENGYHSLPEILDIANKSNTKFFFPEDALFSSEFSNDGDCKNIMLKKQGVPKGWMGLDIGTNTIYKFIEVLKESDIIVWNGPMGVFEFSKFENGSKKIMEYLASHHGKKTTIIGGGDTASCCEKFKKEQFMTHVSTGGGASLELLEGKKLPGL